MDTYNLIILALQKNKDQYHLIEIAIEEAIIKNAKNLATLIKRQQKIWLERQAIYAGDTRIISRVVKRKN